jgi:hypothetical protein
MPRVRLWTPWPRDGELLEPGAVVDLPADEALQICAVGAGELVSAIELAVRAPAERAVAPRQRRGKRRRPA